MLRVSLGRSTMLLTLLLLGVAPPVAATTVLINRSYVTITAIETLTLGAKYRVSSVNFDQSLDSGGGTQMVAGGPNFISTNLGNTAALHNQTLAFALRNLPGQGVVFSLTRPNATVTSLAWGSFAPELLPTPTVSAPQLRAAPDKPPFVATNQPSGTLLSPGFAPMNALHIEVSSRLRNAQDYQPVVTLSDLAFTASGVTIGGTLAPGMAVTPATALPNVAFPEPGAGYASQWLVTTGSFWDFGWTISGNVNASFGNLTAAGLAGDFGEQVKFGISGKQVQFSTTVPEPQSWAMLIAGFGLVGAVMRRRNGVFA